MIRYTLPHIEVLIRMGMAHYVKEANEIDYQYDSVVGCRSNEMSTVCTVYKHQATKQEHKYCIPGGTCTHNNFLFHSFSQNKFFEGSIILLVFQINPLLG